MLQRRTIYRPGSALILHISDENRGRSFCNEERPRVMNKTEGHSLLQKERPCKDK